MATRLFKVGYATTDTPADLHFLTSLVTSNNYDTYKENNVAYQIPNGKNLYICQLMINETTGTGGTLGLTYSTASVNNSTVPAGNVFITTNGSGYLFPGSTTTDTLATFTMSIPVLQPNDYVNSVGGSAGSINSGINVLVF